MNSKNVSFNKDIRPLFRDRDIQAMSAFGLNLSKYEIVKEWAPKIYTRLAEGTMPCDGSWSKKNINLFKKWMDTGYKK